jgi:hypothetical protein
MRVRLWFAVLVGLAFVGPVSAVDLTKIDRPIRKEPIYESKNPLYSFGVGVLTFIVLLVLMLAAIIYRK